MYENIFEYFPQHIREILRNNLGETYLEEIRLRIEKPIILRCNNKEKILSYVLNKLDIEYIFERMCENSIYTYQNQICNRIYNYYGWT